MDSPYPSLGTSDDSRVGNIIKPLNLTAYYSLEYYNSSSTGYHNTESAGCQVRLILYQFKKPVSILNSGYSITDFFPYASNTGSGYTVLANSPFKDGISRYVKILADKRITMTSTRNQINTRIRVKPYNYRFSDDSDIHNQVFGIIIVSGLHYDSDYTEYCTVTAMSKLAYTDS